MKPAATYLAEATRPGPAPPGYICLLQAGQALETALQDAERYRELLVRALRRSRGEDSSLLSSTLLP